jgi:VanZ family protein
MSTFSDSKLQVTSTKGFTIDFGGVEIVSFQEHRVTLNKIFKYWLPVVLWMAVTYLMSTGMFSSENTSLIIGPLIHLFFPSATQQQVNVIHAIVRKLAHVSEYFVLGLLLFRAFRNSATRPHLWRLALFSLAVIVLYAASDEYHQTFVASRTPSIIDVGIDSFGGFLAQCVSVIWLHHRRNAEFRTHRSE